MTVLEYRVYGDGIELMGYTDPFQAVKAAEIVKRANPDHPVAVVLLSGEEAAYTEHDWAVRPYMTPPAQQADQVTSSAGRNNPGRATTGADNKEGTNA